MATRATAADGRADHAVRHGVPLVLAATALFGTIGTARVLGPSASSWSVGSLRLAVAAVVLVVLAARLDRPRHRVARSRSVPSLAELIRHRDTWLAGAAQAAFQLTFLTAVELAGVAVSTLVAIGSAPLVTGLLTRAVTRQWLVATALGLTGLGLLVGGSVSGAAEDSGTGIALALGAGVAYAGYTTASSRLAARAPAASVTAAGFVVAAAVLAPALLVTDHAWLLTAAGVAMVAYLALVATALAYLLFVTGLRHVPPATAQTMGLTEPVVATVLGVLVLGEVLRPSGIAGALLVLAGLSVVARRPGGTPPAPPLG